MISTVKQPPAVSLSDNPLVFGFRSNNFLLSAGSRAKAYMNFQPGGPNPSVNFRFLDQEVTFFMVPGTPDASGTQLPATIYPETDLQWKQRIVPYLYDNYLISKYYDISIETISIPGYLTSQNYIVLTAKDPGSAFTLSITTDNFTAGFIYQNTPGYDMELRPFFNLYAQILVDGRVIGEDLLPIDASGAAYFDFSDYIRPEISPSFRFPEDTSTALILHAEAVKSFIVRYAEFFGSSGSNPGIQSKLYKTGTRYAIAGGVNAMTLSRYGEFSSSFWAQLVNNGQFLTWSPKVRKTAKDDIQKLWFLVPKNITSIKLKVSIKYAVGTNTAINVTTITKQTTTAAMYQIFEIICGWNRLQLDNVMMLTQPNAVALSYDVYCTDQANNLISEVRTFELDDRTYLHKKTFIFRNSFGLMETFTATGESIKEAEYDSLIVNRHRGWSISSKYPDSKKSSVAETLKFTVNSGWITREENDWLRELLLSKEVYEVSGDILYPVVITGTKIGIHKDGEYLYNADIEYVRAFTDDHYSLEGNVRNIPLPHVIVAQDHPNQIALLNSNSSLNTNYHGT